MSSNKNTITVSNITIFKDFSSVNEPLIFDIERALIGISSPRTETIALINSIRLEPDKKRRASLKKKLACIIFSGTFTERKDSAMTEHSGYAVIDFDGVSDVTNLKQRLSLISYVKAAFVSPSGDGVKAIVRIEKSIENHRHNYEQVMEDLFDKLNVPKSQMDSSNINESRICYTSYDPNLFKNSNPTVFKAKEKKKQVVTDYSKLDIAVNMIRLAQEGERHTTVLRASKLAGGYMASGILDEDIARQVLVREIENKFAGENTGIELRALDDGITEGKLMPLYEVETIEQDAKLDKLRVLVSDSRRKYEFLTDPIENEHNLDRYRTGDFKLGEKTGHDELDNYFLFKEGEFNVVLGHANVGKSYFMWWLMTVASERLDWNWLIYSTENKIWQVQKKLIEFYLQQTIKDCSEEDYQIAKDWVDEHFTFIRIDRMYTALELLDFARLLMKEKTYKGFLIDPYNTLKLDSVMLKELGGRHEYDYYIGSEFVSFCDTNNISIFLNAHAVTQAARNKHPKDHMYANHPMPPEAADIEGGGKFTNRVTGFFLVVHRYIYHQTDWKYTNVEVKKVKDVESGGKPTKYEEPVRFQLLNNMTYFKGVNDSGKAIEYKANNDVDSQSSITYKYDFNNTDENPF